MEKSKSRLTETVGIFQEGFQILLHTTISDKISDGINLQISTICGNDRHLYILQRKMIHLYYALIFEREITPKHCIRILPDVHETP